MASQVKAIVLLILSQFIDFDFVLGVITSATSQTGLISILWTAITFGRFYGMYVQSKLTGVESLIKYLITSILCGALPLAFVLIFPKNKGILIVAIIFYGYFSGPSVSLAMDLVNRLCYPTPTSMVFVMFGLNVGTSLVPYLASVAINPANGGYYFNLIIIMFVAMIMTIPLLFISISVSYRKEF